LRDETAAWLTTVAPAAHADRFSVPLRIRLTRLDGR